MTAETDVLPEIRVDFSKLPQSRLRTMQAAGEVVVESMRVLAKTGHNIVGELLRDSENFYEWDHYPDGDIYDPESHAQFYYHAHPQEVRIGEHGHFHTFLRARGIPDGVRPLALPDYEAPADRNDDLSHLIAISMDPSGLPIRLFSTNRWVTGETWYRADDVCALIDRFEIDHAQPSWPVNRWIGAMLQLFQPQAAALIRARDARLKTWRVGREEQNIYEDRDLEITAALDISIDDQISAVAEALAGKDRAAG
ncbi:MAG: hypothetical protein O2880_15460 [Proteobacteria bacterium]|nr:hypothetical protein [Pseudomonadota bacterium]